MDITLDTTDNQENYNEMIPLFSIASKDFDKDLMVLKKFLTNLSKKRTQRMPTSGRDRQKYISILKRND
jgi:hypothetical protein